ncbi:OmcA/MtrC family decaheme c-type cytochrome [Shewanella litorisediminis]|uniref:OmcA/MtrC family decaheme c-type cytochrome n=1 Tax=Shewanella litorisediminis TaxID=1173586 RepID=A0ABX7G6P3_9GAMM|nr:OmcA/MtrC family decaheme c-type cytochrome [Shewanella litorisediminis]MCL2916887.1 OmcA/MtrC family decaheme c-type cytochrome [Shewanella litorisediminis]QRH02947.1 OmcA/MtrC family decaheme c-type cytochrome [Shewanella litorisediminis]
MKNHNKSNLLRTALSTALLAAMLGGCGSDGKDGSDGPDGGTGVHIKSATSLSAKIIDARIEDGRVSVDFSLENANGVAVYGLESFDEINTLGFGIAKLDALQKRDLKGGDAKSSRKGTKPSQWTSYINNLKDPNPAHVPAGFEALARPQIQPGIESSCKVDCIEVLDSGLYRFTFPKALADYPQIDGLNTEFNPELTHRITLELKPTSVVSNATLVNSHYDFIPATGMAAEAEASRELVALQESCIRCHNDDYETASAPKLLMHGAKRTNIENCVVCHTSYAGDPETFATLDFGAMLHRIHQGTYKMVGYGGSIHDYSKVTFPGGESCQSCHIQGEDAPAQASHFGFHRQEACASCHMGEFNVVDQAAWLTPPDGQKDRGFVGNYFHYYATPETDGIKGADVRAVFDAGNCAGCHADTSNPLGSAIFHTSVDNAKTSIRDSYAFSLDNGQFAMLDGKGSLTVTLNWPGEQAPDTDAAVKSLWLVAAAFDGNYQIGYGSSSFGSHPGRFSVDLANYTKYINATIEKSGNGSQIQYRISGLSHANINAIQQGTLSAKLYVCADKASGVAVACDDEQTDITEVVIAPKRASFSLSGDAIDGPVAVVSADKCADCHDTQADFSKAHSRTRATGSPDAGCSSCHTSEPNTAVHLDDGSCVSCHNDSLTAGNSSGHSASRAKAFSRGFDFKVMAHQIHANTRSGRFGNYTTDISFPGNVADCAVCHDKGQIKLDSLAIKKAFLAADGEYSPTVAACASCHAPTLAGNEAAVNHFLQNGGVYQGTQGSYTGGESCAACHSARKTFGFDKVHPVSF